MILIKMDSLYLGIVPENFFGVWTVARCSHKAIISYTSGALCRVVARIRGSLGFTLVCGIFEIKFGNGMFCVHVSRFLLTSRIETRFSQS